MSLLYHPDKYKGPDVPWAEKHWQDINDGLRFSILFLLRNYLLHPAKIAVH